MASKTLFTNPEDIHRVLLELEGENFESTIPTSLRLTIRQILGGTPDIASTSNEKTMLDKKQRCAFCPDVSRAQRSHSKADSAGLGEPGVHRGDHSQHQKITDFLNSFDMSCRGRLAGLNEKLTTLERRIEYLEARVQKNDLLA
ncbi:hypothetical protein GE061_017313 [Apolygus lucorum]|uniref:Uncharacterized protein n=1 Tax=Apolygus lucorum TaxID=248454 RepID=A0A8S9XCU7_APOLU|nr:hypothetical protein GE061_017313 [Apolygus lucorum]